MRKQSTSTSKRPFSAFIDKTLSKITTIFSPSKQSKKQDQELFNDLLITQNQDEFNQDHEDLENVDPHETASSRLLKEKSAKKRANTKRSVLGELDIHEGVFGETLDTWLGIIGQKRVFSSEYKPASAKKLKF